MDPREIEMLRLLSGYWFTQALYVVAALGIADRLEAGSKTTDELAHETRIDRDALYRLLRGLASAGIFAELSPRTFTQNALSETLRANRPQSLRQLALLGGHPLHWQAWGKLLDSVRSGEPAFVAAHGQPFFDALARDDELLRIFHQVQSRTSGVGVTLAAGDFFAGVPGGDAYFLKFTLHDFGDRDAVRILANCRDAMSPDGRVFVIEVVVPGGSEPSISKTHDVNMLVLTGGRERTLPEYESLFARAGLRLLRVIALPSGPSVLEARRVETAG